MKVDIVVSGAVFNGVAAHALHQAIDEVEQAVAEASANHLRDDLGAPPFKHPTGWYRSHVTQRRAGTLWEVWDSMVIYGRWLAGVGSRNASSRFKGYRHWQRTTQWARREAGPIADKVIKRVVRRFS